MGNNAPPVAPSRETYREKIARLLAWCEQRLQTDPQDVAGLVEIGKALWNMGQESRALDFWGKALARNPGDALLRKTIQDYGREFPARRHA